MLSDTNILTTTPATTTDQPKYRQKLQLRRIKDLNKELIIIPLAYHQRVVLFGLPEEIRENILYAFIKQFKSHILQEITALAKDKSLVDEINAFTDELINQICDTLTNTTDDIVSLPIKNKIRNSKTSEELHGILKMLEDYRDQAIIILKRNKYDDDTLKVSQKSWQQLWNYAYKQLPLSERLSRNGYKLIPIPAIISLFLMMFLSDEERQLAPKIIIKGLFKIAFPVLIFYLLLYGMNRVFSKPTTHIQPEEQKLKTMLLDTLIHYAHNRMKENNRVDYTALLSIFPEKSVSSPTIEILPDEEDKAETKSHIKAPLKKSKPLTTSEIIKQQLAANKRNLQETKEREPQDLRNNEDHYIRLNDHQGYLKLNVIDIKNLHPEKAKQDKTGQDIVKRFHDEIKKDRTTDALTSTEKTSVKSPYINLDTKVRLGGNAYRLGLLIRPPTQEEINLGIPPNEIVQSPKVMAKHNRGGYK